MGTSGESAGCGEGKSSTLSGLCSYCCSLLSSGKDCIGPTFHMLPQHKLCCFAQPPVCVLLFVDSDHCKVFVPAQVPTAASALPPAFPT